MADRQRPQAVVGDGGEPVAQPRFPHRRPAAAGVPAVVGGQRRERDHPGDGEIDRRPESDRVRGADRHDRSRQHLDEQVDRRGQHQPHDDLAQHPDAAQRPDRHRGRHHAGGDRERPALSIPTTRAAAMEITISSVVAQPMFCARFSTVGTVEPRRPSRPRSAIMAGAPVVAPNAADEASSADPISTPSTIATKARVNDPVASATVTPVSGPNRLIPRFAHNRTWSSRSNGRGGSALRVSGASAAAGELRRPPSPGTGGRRSRDSMRSRLRHGHLPTPAPGQFGRSADPDAHTGCIQPVPRRTPTS